MRLSKEASVKAADPSLNPTTAYILGHIEVARSSGIIKQQEFDGASVLTGMKAAAKAEADRAKKNDWKMTKAQYDQC